MANTSEQEREEIRNANSALLRDAIVLMLRLTLILSRGERIHIELVDNAHSLLKKKIDLDNRAYAVGDGSAPDDTGLTTLPKSSSELVLESYKSGLSKRADELLKAGEIYDAVKLLLKAERN